MKTPSQRQDYLIANPIMPMNDEAKAMTIMNAWLLSDLFRLNNWTAPIHAGTRERRWAEQTSHVLNGSVGIVWC